MVEHFIESRQNPQVKALVRLRDRKHRDRQGRFIVEGLRELEHACEASVPIDTLYFCPELFPSDQHAEFVNRFRTFAGTGEGLARVSAAVFEKICYREGPDGLLATAQPNNHTLTHLKLSPNPLVLILEGIEKPGNLGAILRTADATGVDGVILVDCIIDLYNPNAIRASQGLIFQVPIAFAEAEGTKTWLAERKIIPYALTPHARDTLWQSDLSAATAIVMGAEDTGLSETWLNENVRGLRIPMAGRADSLNVAAATAVCLYEAQRQRASAS